MSARLRARHSAAVRHYGPDDPRVTAARERLREAGAEEYIAELVAQAPALSIETRSRLAALLLAPSRDGAR